MDEKPLKWFDLVTFDKEWLKDKILCYVEDEDGVQTPLVFDQHGNQVYPDPEKAE
jgi:hypothetical protein